jgi:ABC-type branched-subunit amino acid transport system substrate-binding protein
MIQLDSDIVSALRTILEDVCGHLLSSRASSTRKRRRGVDELRRSIAVAVAGAVNAMFNADGPKASAEQAPAHVGRSTTRENEMSVLGNKVGVAALAVVILAASASMASAQKKYDSGATDSTIKLGNIMPYSGPASAYGVIGKTEAAYFKMINDQGGINGRKIDFISYDDAYSPPKAVEQVRKLVESDEVLLIFNSLGTPSNSAIQKYMNAKKVPQLFVATTSGNRSARWRLSVDYPH